MVIVLCKCGKFCHSNLYLMPSLFSHVRRSSCLDAHSFPFESRQIKFFSLHAKNNNGRIYHLMFQIISLPTLQVYSRVDHHGLDFSVTVHVEPSADPPLGDINENDALFKSIFTQLPPKSRL